MANSCRCVTMNKNACRLKKRSVFDLIKNSEKGILLAASRQAEDAEGVNGLQMPLKEIQRRRFVTRNALNERRGATKESKDALNNP